MHFFGEGGGVMLKVPHFSEKHKSFVLFTIIFQLSFQPFVHFESKFNLMV
jgi:hypothetical protein